VDLWTRLQSVHLDIQSEDRFIWKWTANLQYLASSVYRVFFVSQVKAPRNASSSRGRSCWDVFGQVRCVLRPLKPLCISCFHVSLVENSGLSCCDGWACMVSSRRPTRAK
jgi:hypothetical protein